MSEYLRIYIPTGKKRDDIVNLIGKLQDKVSVECKKLEHKFNAKYNKFFDKKMKLLNKTTKTKEHGIFKNKTDDITLMFNNSEIYKEYVKNINKNINSQLIDKTLLKKYKTLKNKYLKNLASALRTYYMTPMYIKYKNDVKNLQNDLVKTKESRDVIHCAFKHCREDYAFIIKLLLENIKGDKRNIRVYNYLNKIDHDKITLTQYKRVTHIFNRVNGKVFNYVNQGEFY